MICLRSNVSSVKSKCSSPPMVFFILALMASNDKFFSAQRVTNRANMVATLSICVLPYMFLVHKYVCMHNIHTYLYVYMYVYYACLAYINTCPVHEEYATTA